MSTLELKVYDIFKSRFSEQEASMVIEYLDVKTKQGIDEKASVFQTLQTKDLGYLRKEMHTVFASKDDFNNLRVELKESKSDILKWMFGLFVPLYLTIIGLIITLLLKH